MKHDSEMEVSIRPLGDGVTLDYMDKLSNTIHQMVRRIHEKDPKGPFLEVSFIVKNHKDNEPCVHDFVVRDIAESMVVVQCLKCHSMFHAGYTTGELRRVGP